MKNARKNPVQSLPLQENVTITLTPDEQRCMYAALRAYKRRLAQKRKHEDYVQYPDALARQEHREQTLTTLEQKFLDAQQQQQQHAAAPVPASQQVPCACGSPEGRWMK